jgi:SAM-dependent methyltransferase
MMTLTRPDAIRLAMNRSARLEREWPGRVPDNDRLRTPFMPFSIPAFLALLLEAIPGAPGNRFLDVGSGVGAKMLLARDICGLDVTGIEIVPEYIRQADSAGLMTWQGDAAEFHGYGDHDLIWMYRPFRDPDAQAGLEKRIQDQMAPGAVLLGAGLEAPPPPESFHIILDDWEVRRGIWMKAPTSP